MQKLILICCFLIIIGRVGFSQGNLQSIQNFEVLSQKVLNHFEFEPKKKMAAQFLLQGMLNQGSVLPIWKDRSNKIIQLNEFQYESFETAVAAFNSFSSKGAIRSLEYVRDIEQIDANFLIKNIEHSFTTWQESPWYKNYTFENFCEYVLPYRNSLEPLEKDLKQKYSSFYKGIFYTASNSADPVDVCTELIKSLAHIQFVDKRRYPQPMLSVDQIRFRGQGNCTDLANMVLLIGRSIGLGITYDYTPYYAASSNSHYWNSVLDRDCNFIPFNGNSDLPYIYNATSKRMGKVLRQTFSAQKNSLPALIPIDYIPTNKLKLANVIDVTNEYVATSSITYVFQQNPAVRVGYITVFNQGEWKPLWWSELDKNSKAVFENMGRNIVYLPGYVKPSMVSGKSNQTLDLEEYPILLQTNGLPRILKPSLNSLFSAKISRFNEEDFGYKDFNSIELENEKFYNLYYWNGDWKFIGRKKCENNGLYFDKLPRNALFRITPDVQDGFERIFTIEPNSNKILWY
ncbi:transglutaminase domain-containing protein [Pseudotamlana carrageenivorans]|uniref:Transglutaminase-like domain-containing protein n=1 Tax=Pseudotamlana carrageenivorans TaxID=2069432 RepID=A0A2I7SHG5_9FLAO|nr:transglutaminase domain-containing protein [Tamlana carrageenivorans]AUS05347.1 hypothetical protein C1A40_07590 [Tamlana carrageenivorans]